MKVILLLGFLLLTACSPVSSLPALPPDAIILAFGDSITFGTGAASAESYPAVLEQRVSRRVVNAGVPGEITAEGVRRLPELLDRERPALMILCEGGNDFLRHVDPKETAANLREMVRMARERGAAVILLGVPAVNLSLEAPHFYREIAREFQIPYDNEILPRILGKRSLKSDYIHPNTAGYRLMAESIEKLMKKHKAL